MTRRALGVVTITVIALSALVGEGRAILSRPVRTGRDAAVPPAVTADDVRVRDLPSTAAPATPAAPSAPAAPTSRAPARAPGGTPAPTPKVVDNAAARLRTLPAATRQVVIVSAADFTTSYATVQTFAKTNGVWQPALGTMAARIGSGGFADHKVEGDLKTPTGVYAFGPTMYGIAGNPGVRYGFHTLVEGDYWNENPASAGYNTFVHGADPGGGSEALWQVSPQYRYLAVVNYNVPAVAANPPRGSAIFLHEVNPGHSTLGCISLAESDLLRVLRWLDPSASPRIVLAPVSALSRY